MRLSYVLNGFIYPVYQCSTPLALGKTQFFFWVRRSDMGRFLNQKPHHFVALLLFWSVMCSATFSFVDVVQEFGTTTTLNSIDSVTGCFTTTGKTITTSAGAQVSLLLAVDYVGSLGLSRSHLDCIESSVVLKHARIYAIVCFSQSTGQFSVPDYSYGLHFARSLHYQRCDAGLYRCGPCGQSEHVARSWRSNHFHRTFVGEL